MKADLKKLSDLISEKLSRREGDKRLIRQKDASAGPVETDAEQRCRLNEQLALSQQNLESANRELEAAILKANQMAADAEIRNYQLEEEIERRKETERKLRISEEKYRSIIDNIEEGYYEVDVQGQFLFVNDSICDLLQLSREALLNMNSLDIFDKADQKAVIETYDRVYRCDEPRSAYCFEAKMPDGARRHMETSIALIKDAAGKKTGFRGIVRDVEQRKRYEEKLVYLAYHDALTGLNNRKAFYEKLEEGLAYARRYQTEIALVYIDIDRFKQVNDTLGHEFGDQLLVEIAQRLKACVRETDFVFRIGGDEFTVILSNPKQANPEVVAERIVRKLSNPYTLYGISIDYISASVGISRYPLDARDAAELIKSADTAMYQAKQERNRYLCYTA